MSDTRKYFCFCEANCKFETMTKEQILAAIAQAAETGLVIDPDAAFITKVKEANSGKSITFWAGTKAQYNALDSIDENCFYILTDCASYAELAYELKETKEAAENAADVAADAQTTAAEAAAAAASAASVASKAQTTANTAANKVPTPSSSDNGKFLRVVSGKAAWVTVSSAEGASF